MTQPISTVNDLVLALRVRFTDTEDVRTTKKAVLEVDDGTGQLDLPLRPGPRGFPGMSIVAAAVVNGYLVLTRDDGTQFNAGPANQPGPRGPAGLGLTPTVVKTADYTAKLGEVVRVNASGGPVAITLPGAVTGGTCAVVRLDAGTAAVTVVPFNEDTLDVPVALVGPGAASQFLAGATFWTPLLSGTGGGETTPAPEPGASGYAADYSAPYS